MTSTVNPIVSVSWLKDNISNPKSKICLLDSSWHLPSFKRDAIQEYKKGHIAGARFFDIGLYNGGLPDGATFTKDVHSLGVGVDAHVVVYDSNAAFGMFSAPRAWWLWRAFGHRRVSVLDGGLPAWLAEGGPLTAVIPPEVDEDAPQFAFEFAGNCVKSLRDIEDNVTSKVSNVVDCRSSGRFNGIEPEPRAGIKSGHIINSINIPFPCFMTNEKRMKSADDLAKLLADNNVDFKKPTIATCGSGVSACFMILAANIINEEVSLYDGAWIDFYKNGANDLKIVSTK